MRVKDRIAVLVFVALLCVVFFAQNTVVPFFSDDLWWHGSIDTQSVSTFVQSVLKSQQRMWMTENGRAMNHLVWQLTVAGGERLYDLFITLCLVVTIVSLRRLTVSRGSSSEFWPWVVIAVLLFYAAPDYDSLFYWAAGGCHYLFPSAMTMCTLLMLRRVVAASVDAFGMVWSCVLAFVAGWTHETFALPVSFALLVYVVGRPREVPCRLWLVILSFWLGASLIVLSPGTWHRILTTQGGEFNLLARLLTSFKVFRYGRFFYAVVALVVWLALSRRRSLRDFLRYESFFLWCLLGSLGIVFVLGVGGRAVWSVEVFSLIVLLRWLNHEVRSVSRWVNAGVAALAVLIVVHQACLVAPFRESWATYSDMVALRSQMPKAENCVPMQDWHSSNVLVNPFVAHPYKMMRDDVWMRMPLYCTVCKPEEYAILQRGIPLDGAVRVGDDIYVAYSGSVMSEIERGAWVYDLRVFDNTSPDGGAMYKAWHRTMQFLFPSRYPLRAAVSPSAVTRIRVADHEYLRFERPYLPVQREIEAVVRAH